MAATDKPYRNQQTLNVVFTGTGYVTGVTTADFGSGITVNTTTVNSATQLTANITITAAAAPGPRPATVTNPDGQFASLSNAFTYITQQVLSMNFVATSNGNSVAIGSTEITGYFPVSNWNNGTGTPGTKSNASPKARRNAGRTRSSWGTRSHLLAPITTPHPASTA